MCLKPDMKIMRQEMTGLMNTACKSKTNGALTSKSKDISQINQSKVYKILWNRKEIIYIT